MQVDDCFSFTKRFRSACCTEFEKFHGRVRGGNDTALQLIDYSERFLAPLGLSESGRLSLNLGGLLFELRREHFHFLLLLADG